MHHSAKSLRFNKVNSRNDQVSTSCIDCAELLPSQPLSYSEKQQIIRKCAGKKCELTSCSSKRAFNLQANNIYDKNVYSSLKMPNSFQNFYANNEQISPGTYLSNKYNSKFNTKECTTSKNYLQNIDSPKSVNKLTQETKKSSYKKCEKIPKLQNNFKRNPQVLLNDITHKLAGSLCDNVDQKTEKDSILCSDDKLHNENIMQSKDNKSEEKFGENVGDYVNDCTGKTREKTPMCLINDLARFNKISFQYRLTSENGPAHCKKFTVTLKLGDEEYTAEGFKIKKAQHLAAKEAIEKTKYKHPVPKTNRRNGNEATKINITPTVELNALAMKLGQQTYYILDPKQTPSSGNNINNDASQMPKLISNNNRLSFDKCEHRYTKIQNYLEPTCVSNFSTCKITLIVGNQKFIGIGKSLQQAKHDAATNALQILKNQVSRNKVENFAENLNENEHKSPISLVFETGIKRNLPVHFKVLREEGPAHMRTFTTACIVGNIVTEGEGTGKKLSKKKAAQMMLEELKKLPPLSSDTPPIKRTKNKSSRKSEGFSVNSVTDWKKNKKNIAETDSCPVTKVLEWHQNNNEKEPVFKLISESEKTNTRRRQFVMEISSNKINARGIGNSKKLAKRDAAQNFLDALNKNNGDYSNKSKILSGMHLEGTSEEIYTTMDQEQQNLISDDIKVDSNGKEQNVDHGIAANSVEKCVDKKLSKSSKQKNTVCKSSALRMKDQLMYLSNLLGFKVDFSDYPKGNHNEFLTIVMLSTNPPQISHGVGINSKESQEDASRNALKILSEMGLNNAAKP